MTWRASQMCVTLRRRIPLLWPFFWTFLFRAHAALATTRGAVYRTGAAAPGRPRCLLLLLVSSSARPWSRVPDDGDWDLPWALFCGRAAAAAAASGGAE